MFPCAKRFFQERKLLTSLSLRRLQRSKLSRKSTSEPLSVEPKSMKAEVYKPTTIAAELDPPLFSSKWWKNQATVSTVLSIIMILATTTIGFNQLEMSQKMNETKEKKSLYDIQQSEKQHEDYFVQQVERYLLTPYRLVHDNVSDTPDLHFIDRDGARTATLNNIMASAGGLTLLEGPSGCGKTTSVQHCLADMQTAGVYFSVRDNASGLAPLAAFVRAFGITDPPMNMSGKCLDIVRKALEKRKREEKFGTPPVLVIDDVQELLKPPYFDKGGMTILYWCLGRAASGELTVLFVSSETVQHVMRQLSGYKTRLSTPDSPFEYISAATLKTALEAIKSAPCFKREEAEAVVSVIGTHMSDVRSIQRLRTERGLTVEDAVSELVNAEARALKSVLFEDAPQDARSSNEEKLRSLVAYYLCDVIASDITGRPVSTSQLEEVVKRKLSKKLAEPFRSSVKGTFVSSVMFDLMARNVLRRSFEKGKIDEDIAFHRPVLYFAFNKLLSSERVKNQLTCLQEELFEDAAHDDARP